jgi:hypothetical protein
VEKMKNALKFVDGNVKGICILSMDERLILSLVLTSVGSVCVAEFMWLKVVFIGGNLFWVRNPSSRQGGRPTTYKTAAVLTTAKIWS